MSPPVHISLLYDIVPYPSLFPFLISIHTHSLTSSTLLPSPSVPLLSFLPSLLSFPLPPSPLLSLPADATLLKDEMDLIRTQGDQHAQLVVDEIKIRSISTQKLLEGRLREEAELARRLTVKNR